MKTAQGLLGHSDSRLTLDHYAQVVSELGALAAEPMGERFMKTPARDSRAMEGGSGSSDARPRTRREACDQALCILSGGGDLNSRPLRPERASERTTRLDTRHSAPSGVYHPADHRLEVGRMLAGPRVRAATGRQALRSRPVLGFDHLAEAANRIHTR